MNDDNREIQIKRVSSRKRSRSRDSLKSHLTPVRKRTTASVGQCSDNTGERAHTRTMGEVKFSEVDKL